MKKKIAAVVITLALALSSVVFAGGTTINDLDKSSSYAKGAIQYLAEQNIISGDQNGNFNPQKSLTRAEMVALLVRAMNLDTTKTPETATFADVPTNNWAYKYVETAFSQGIVAGISTTEFRPNDKITREQMAIIYVRALKLINSDNEMDFNNINYFSDKAKISPWAKKEVEAALESGLMNGVSSKLFEPKLSANKEQAAVVTEKFLKDKENIIAKFKEQLQDEASIKTTLNNEAILLKNKIVVKENKVFVPVEFLNKFILDASIYDIEEDAQVIELYPAQEIAAKGIEVLWMKVGNAKAYKNIEEDPFTASNVPTENTMELMIAPMQLEGKTYVSIDELVKILGIDYQYLSDANTLNIYTPTANKNVNFYFALKQLAYNDYVGEMKSQGEVKLSDKKTNQYSRAAYDMQDKQNDNYTVWSYAKETLEVSGQTPKVTEVESITIDKKTYQKDFADNKWVQKNLKNGYTYINTIFFDPIFENEEVKNVEMNARLFNNYNRLDVKKEGTAYISGIPTTKYVLEYDENSIKNIMTDEEYAVIKEFANVNFGGNLSYRQEFYVFNSTVIKQTFLFDGNMIDAETGNPINYHSAAAVYYKNIGKKSVITAPPASQVKQIIE